MSIWPVSLTLLSDPKPLHLNTFSDLSIWPLYLICTSNTSDPLTQTSDPYLWYVPLCYFSDTFFWTSSPVAHPFFGHVFLWSAWLTLPSGQTPLIHTSDMYVCAILLTHFLRSEACHWFIFLTYFSNIHLWPTSLNHLSDLLLRPPSMTHLFDPSPLNLFCILVNDFKHQNYRLAEPLSTNVGDSVEFVLLVGFPYVNNQCRATWCPFH